MTEARKFLTVGLIAAFMVLCGRGLAMSQPAGELADCELKQVALFKNGLGFFILEAEIPPKALSFTIAPAAAASHGTFWVSYQPKVKLAGVVAREIDTEEQVEATTIQEMLRANIGRKVRLSMVSDKEEAVEGVIKSAPSPQAAPSPNPYLPGRPAMEDRSGYYRPGNLVVIETEEGEVALNSERVGGVEFVGGKSERMITRKGKGVRLDVRLGAPAGGEKLMVSYLAKGVTWVPSYVVDITEPNNAKIAAKAEVMNEVCDFNGITVQLVTGYPNLQFADVVSPLAMKENLSQFLQSLIRGQTEQGRAGGVLSNVMVQRMAYGAELRDRDSSSIMPAYGAAEQGKVAEDLFLYPLEKVQLAKGDVGYFPLFTESAQYKHIYRWEIPDYTDSEGQQYYDQRRQKVESDQQVWHCVRMTNQTKVPWTTAPAEVIKEGIILGQDTLDYTPAKAEATLRITRAVSVKADQLELEIDRKRDAMQLYGYHYDLVTLEGKLSVTNFQDKAIELEISKTLSGEVKTSQPEAKVEKQARGVRQMNELRKLTWTIGLQPGEQKLISYTYDVYVRR